MSVSNGPQSAIREELNIPLTLREMFKSSEYIFGDKRGKRVCLQSELEIKEFIVFWIKLFWYGEGLIFKNRGI